MVNVGGRVMIRVVHGVGIVQVVKVVNDVDDVHVVHMVQQDRHL